MNQISYHFANLIPIRQQINEAENLSQTFKKSLTKN